MSEHSHTRIWIHMILHTKELHPYITHTNEKEIHTHIVAQLAEMQCPVFAINGTRDHVHILYQQHPSRTVTDVAKQIKGNTSYWINHYGISKQRFAWEKGFNCFTVSDNDILTVVACIENQKKFHETGSFHEELDHLIASFSDAIPPGVTLDLIQEVPQT